MLKFDQILKRIRKIIIYSLVSLFLSPLGMLMKFDLAHASDKAVMPVRSKIQVIENPMGENDLVRGLPGAVGAFSLVEVFPIKDQLHLIGETKADSQGAFTPISIGNNLYSNIGLRYELSGASSPVLTLENDITPPVVKGENLKEIIYWQGTVIHFTLKSEPGVQATAKIGELDPTFPEKIRLNVSNDGIVSFVSPKLSQHLIAGSHQIEVMIIDRSGNVTKKFTAVNLKKYPTPKIHLITATENSLNIYWDQVKIANYYQVEWRTVDGLSSKTKIVRAPYHSLSLEGLQQGTNYQISISAQNGATSENEVSNFQTKGIAHVVSTETATKVVKANAEVKPSTKTVAPAIAEGVSTQANRSTVAEPVSPSPKATPSAEPSANEESQEETTTNSWSRLLIVLSILIIAAGVAIGGYYGYEWMAAARDNDPDKPKKGSRW